MRDYLMIGAVLITTLCFASLVSAVFTLYELSQPLDLPPLSASTQVVLELYSYE